MLRTVLVETPSRRYPVVIGDGLLGQLGTLLRQHGIDGALRVISDARVQDLHGAQVAAALEEAGYRVALASVPSGEASKSLAQAASLYEWLVEVGSERGDVILALGGGVVGDLAGFVAATYLRGVRFVQIPTTLLAQVDASVGGKVAVNLPQGKNLVGAFHQPELVVIDIATLRTLPERELRAGWAEVVKTGMILDEHLFARLEQERARLAQLAPEATTEVIQRCVELKGQVVAADERDSGLRAILNYGHTVAHAIEAVSEYHTYLHGEAVAIGMAAAAEIAVGMGLLAPSERTRQNDLLLAFGLPLAAEALSRDQVRAAIGRDKKVRGGRVSWVLARRVGEVEVRRDVPDNLVDQALAQHLR